jgi:hypothetical protein
MTNIIEALSPTEGEGKARFISGLRIGQGRSSPGRRRCLVQQIRQHLLPPPRFARGAATAGLGGCRILVVTGVADRCALALEDAEFDRVALVIGGIDRQNAGLDLFQTGRWIVVARGVIRVYVTGSTAVGSSGKAEC